MPTLTPKPPNKQGVRWAADVVGAAQFPNIEENNSSSKQHRIGCVDSLRGILSVVVVIHHFRCAFDPCSVFGGSTEWIGDANECPSSISVASMFWNTLTNGTFAVATFFVLSGCVLSHTVWKSSMAHWRISVAKRFFRLGIPVAAAILFAYPWAGSIAHEEQVAPVTNSLWLVRLAPTRPSPVTGLISQMIWGVWRGSCSLNNSLWTLRYELFGSFLTFGVVQLVKRLSHRLRSQWLGCLFLFLLVPWPTRRISLKAHVLYEGYRSLPGKIGEKRKTKTVMKEVVLDPIKHSHTLSHMQDLIDASHSGGSALEVNYFDETTLVQPTPEKGRKGRELLYLDQTSDSADIYRDLLQAAGAKTFGDKSYSVPRIEIRKSAVWTYENRWLWYACFAAGMWISEARLSRRTGTFRPKAGILLLLPEAAQSAFFDYFPVIFAVVCSSYPFTPVLADQFWLWRFMGAVAQLLGYSSGQQAQSLWCILGAFSFVNHLLLYSRRPRRILEQSALLRWLGDISFALYLIHIPILYSVSCTIFARYYHGDLWHDDSLSSSAWAVFLSVPAMLGTAFCFSKAVDTPATLFSGAIAEWLLGCSNVAVSGETVSIGNKESTSLPSSVPLLDETETSDSSM